MRKKVLAIFYFKLFHTQLVNETALLPRNYDINELQTNNTVWTILYSSKKHFTV